MTVKENVLDALENNRGTYVSGEKIAEKLGVSRQSVGKAVNALKADGYTVYASTNKGYMLAPECDVLSSVQIREKTGTRVLLFDSVTSTNSVAAKEFLTGGQCIVIGRTQTAGRKKDGGCFVSPLDKGIYFSVAMPVSIPVTSLTELRRICGNAVAEVITSSCGKKAECVNEDEVYIGGKKVAGILIECAVNAASRQTQSAVIGIGIYTSENFKEGPLGSVFPDDTRNKMIADVYLRIASSVAAMSENK